MHEADNFSKNLLHLLTDLSSNGPAGQFWQMEKMPLYFIFGLLLYKYVSHVYF